MGSSTSGNHGGKRTTSDTLQLDVRKLQRDGLLRPAGAIPLTWHRNGKPFASIEIQADADKVRLIYQAMLGGDTKDYPVLLAWTPCQYGGRRVWWLCPGAGCGRRVAVLYASGGVFACRHCQQLAYRSQRETLSDREIRRSDKLRDRLGWKPGLLNGNGGKPKGMHWKTFWSLRASHEAQAQRIFGGMLRKLGKSPADL